MLKTALFTIALLLIALVYNCQYPVDSSVLPELKKFIVIDARLTEKYGSVSVGYSLTGVTPQGDYQTPVPPVASAYILDSHGNRTDFATDGTVDSSFHGVVGEIYRLHVEADGNVYESKAETMPACPELDTVAPVYSREASRDPDDLLYDGFDVYVQFRDIPGQENYYQWDWVHYGRRAACGTTVENGQEVLLPCTPYDCWGIVYNDRVIVQSDNLRDGQDIAQKVVRVPFATPPKKYYLRVEQRAVTPSVFAYLKSIETQTQNVGTLFDIPAQTRFSPNIYNVNDPQEQILGAFSVFSYRRKIIYIDMSRQIPGAVAKVIKSLPFSSDPLAQAPCKEGRYQTQKKPEGWED